MIRLGRFAGSISSRDLQEIIRSGPYGGSI